MRDAIFLRLLVVTMLTWLVPCPGLHGFSFRNTEEREAREVDQQQAEETRQMQRMLSVPCRDRLKKKKIAVIIGERHLESSLRHDITPVSPAGSDSPNNRANPGLLFEQINIGLRKLGLKTYSQAEITAQIAQAELTAFLNNDMDAAIGAAERLKAHFFLRGVIDSTARENPVVGINEVFIRMAFTLVDASGRLISKQSAQGASFAGADTLAAALELVKKHADGIVARLYYDYCQSAAPRSQN